ncbi:MAG: carboxypeptidase-like regulatory domain-containing protein [Cyclobacteriaceae bacterium]
MPFFQVNFKEIFSSLLNKLPLTGLLVLLALPGFATTISGKIADEKGEALPFTTLYVENTTKGTSSNVDGFYSIELAPGEYNLVFQYVGFKKEVKAIEVGTSPVVLNVILRSEALELNEVVVNATDEDPAYRIIREAIKKRKFHKEQVQAYKCQVYIKGMQTIEEKPDKVFGFVIPLDTGIVYLSESISELSFEQPDKIKEVMISSKVSGNNNTFSYNQGSQMLFSFYDNLLKAEGLSERGYVSPISNNAMLFYEYKMEGFIQEKGLMINKIKVIPRRKNDPVFSGYIYILEDSWRIHSVDLTLTKEHQLEFIDNLNIRQVYAPIQGDIWMMISQKFSFSLDIFGFKGVGNFIGLHSDYEIQVNDKLISNSTDTIAQNETEQDTLPIIQKLFPKKYFNNEILVIEDDSNQKDSTYWARVRPVPLTNIEIADYTKKDSLEEIHNSKPYKDSVDRVVNKLSLANVVYSGYVYQKSFEEKYFRFEPIIENLEYNTVEGAVVFLKSTYNKSKKGILKYQLVPEIRYGFSSRKAYGQLFGRMYYNPRKFSRALLQFGNFVYQFNGQKPISPFVNSLETILNRQNLIKLYEKNFFRVAHQSEISNGILVTSNLEYAHRKELFNTTDYSIFRTDEREFTVNRPLNNELANTSFGTSNTFQYDVHFTIRIKQKYISRPDQKYVMGTKYPIFRVLYSKGFSAFGSDVDYDKIAFDIRDDIDYQLLGSGNYFIAGGTFLNDNKVAFMDYKHFNGGGSILAKFKKNYFQLMDYYQFSTTNGWFSAQYNHHFNGFLINKFPLLRKTKMQAVGTVNYLYTDTSGNYLEYGFGLEHIVKVFRIDFYMAHLDGKHYGRGIRMGFGF